MNNKYFTIVVLFICLLVLCSSFSLALKAEFTVSLDDYSIENIFTYEFTLFDEYALSDDFLHSTEIGTYMVFQNIGDVGFFVLKETNIFDLYNFVEPLLLVFETSQGDFLISHEINFCNNNAVCEPFSPNNSSEILLAESHFTCPNDCPLDVPDNYCVAKVDEICDPDCLGEDVDCVNFNQERFSFLYDEGILEEFNTQQINKEEELSKDIFFEDHMEKSLPVMNFFKEYFLRIVIVLLLLVCIFFIGIHTRSINKATSQKNMQLKRYVLSLKEQGYSDEIIKQTLEKNQYSQKMIRELFKVK
jgi:hypothetical protein